MKPIYLFLLSFVPLMAVSESDNDDPTQITQTISDQAVSDQKEATDQDEPTTVIETQKNVLNEESVSATFEPQHYSAEQMQPPTIGAPPQTPSVFKPHIAAGLSSLIPGLGHYYLGEPATGNALLASFLVSGAYGLTSIEPPRNEGDPVRMRRDGFAAAQNVSFYSVYAAYRDGRIQQNDLGVQYKLPTDSFKDLAWAPFSWEVLRKPEVWGFLTTFAILQGFAYSILTSSATDAAPTTDFAPYSPFIAFPIGIGEEALFRGFLQPALGEKLTPWASIITTSLLFAAVHIPNAKNLPPESQQTYYKVALPYIATLGTYFGWVSYKNQSLRESVALHAWYDFLVFSTAATVRKSARHGKPSATFALSLPF